MPVITDSLCTGINGADTDHQQDLVQKWINSIVPLSREPSLCASVESGICVVSDRKIDISEEDDLLLGAEAKLLPMSSDISDEQIASSSLYLKEKEFIDGGHILRQRFAQRAEDSFNSESSRHSLEQLLIKHRIDPERVLTNLGFASHSNCTSNRLPRRFLLASSRANGISVEEYVSQNSTLLCDDLGQKSLDNPHENSYGISEGEKQETTPAVSDKTYQAFSQVAQTVTLINRFRARMLRNRATTCFDPVLRLSNSGSKYWSILEEENSSYLDQFGYYDGLKSIVNDSERQNVGKSAWAAAKVATLKKIDKLNDLETSRMYIEPVSVKSYDTAHDYSVGISVQDQQHSVSVVKPDISGTSAGFIGQTSTDIPMRFLCQLSTYATSLQHEMQVCTTQPNISVESELPIIEINNNAVASDMSGCEWYHSSSVSSSTTDDYSPSGDSYFGRLQTLQIYPVVESNDTDKLGLLASASDNASTISSHTLIDDDGTIDKNVKVSDDMLAAALQLTICHNLEGSDDIRQIQEDNVTEIATMVNNNSQSQPLHSRIRYMLLRQGSSQSDSSGFADSEQADLLCEVTSHNASTSKPFIHRSRKQMQLVSPSFTTIDDCCFDCDNGVFSRNVSTLSAMLNVVGRSEIVSNVNIMPDVHDGPLDYANCVDILTKNDQWTQTLPYINQLSEKLDCTSDVSPSLSDGTMSCHTLNNINLADSNQIELHLYDDDDDLLLDKNQSRNYTTSIYIDSLIPTVPLREKTEVMLLLGTNFKNEESDHAFLSLANNSKHLPQYKTVLDADVMKSTDGRVIVSPVNYNTVPVKVEGKASKMTTTVTSDATNRTCTHERMHGRLTKYAFDITDHYILHSMMERTAFMSPHVSSFLTPPSEWLAMQSAASSICQVFVEEVKLVQQALSKFRLELCALRLRARVKYADNEADLLHEDRNTIVNLHSDIIQEINNLDRLLSQRMKFVINCVVACNVEPASDLSSLHIIEQMIDILKEQLYHSSIVNGMFTAVHKFLQTRYTTQSWHCILCHELHDHFSDLSSVITESIFSRMSSLEQKIVEWQQTSECMIMTFMKQVHGGLITDAKLTKEPKFSHKGFRTSWWKK